MKKITLFFFVLFSINANSQSYYDGNAILKVSYPFLDFSVIDDQTRLSMTFIEIMNDNGKKELAKLEQQYPGLKDFQVSKVFPNLTTKDTVSISRLGERVTIPPFWAIFRVEIPQQYGTLRFVDFMNEQHKFIEYAQPDFQVKLQSGPSDTLYYKQRSLNDTILTDAHINVEQAWAIETGKPWVKVGIHDDGIDSLHPDLSDALVFGGTYNYGDTSYPPSNWGTGSVHGHAIASIIGAKRDNITGIAGIAGGDTSLASGVSLIDLKFNYYSGLSSAYLMAGVVDAARSVGSYWDYPDIYYSQPQ